MSDDELRFLFDAIEERVRALGLGHVVDEARHHARLALLRTLRAILEMRREKQFIRGMIDEAVHEARLTSYTRRYFHKPS